jgi:hypothetical protein
MNYSPRRIFQVSLEKEEISFRRFEILFFEEELKYNISERGCLTFEGRNVGVIDLNNVIFFSSDSEVKRIELIFSGFEIRLIFSDSQNFHVVSGDIYSCILKKKNASFEEYQSKINSLIDSMNKLIQFFETAPPEVIEGGGPGYNDGKTNFEQNKLNQLEEKKFDKLEESKLNQIEERKLNETNRINLRKTI